MHTLITNGQYNYSALRDMAERYRRAVYDRADKLCKRAGIYSAVHAHNAVCDMQTRSGWLKGKSESDIQLIKRADYMLKVQQWRAHRVLDSLYKRLSHTAFNWQ